MINTNHQALLARISELSAQNSQQSKQLSEKRLSDDIQSKKLEERRVDNKNQVDLKAPNESNSSRLGTANSTKPESEVIFDNYTEKGRKNFSNSEIGTRISIRV